MNDTAPILTELEAIACDVSRPMPVRQRARKKAARIVFAEQMRDEFPEDAEHELDLTTHCAADDRARYLIKAPRLTVRRRGGCERRPGARRAASRSAGGGSSGDPDPAEPGEPARRYHRGLDSPQAVAA